jgi:hypothetical protein
MPRKRVRRLAQVLGGEPGGGTEVIAGELAVVATSRAPIGPATSIASTGLMRGKMAGIVAKPEGRSLLSCTFSTLKIEFMLILQ